LSPLFLSPPADAVIATVIIRINRISTILFI
jgi:hypothetical protein